jgi:hypothetical protein
MGSVGSWRGRLFGERAARPRQESSAPAHQLGAVLGWMITRRAPRGLWYKQRDYQPFGSPSVCCYRCVAFYHCGGTLALPINVFYDAQNE